MSSLAPAKAVIDDRLDMKAKTWFAILSEAAAFDARGTELQTTPMPPDIRVSVLSHGRRVFPECVVGDRLEQNCLRANQDLACAQRPGSARDRAPLPRRAAMP